MFGSAVHFAKSFGKFVAFFFVQTNKMSYSVITPLPTIDSFGIKVMK